MSLDKQELSRLASDAWRLLTGLEAVHCEVRDRPEHHELTRSYGVSVSGSQEVDVWLQCGRELAERVASAMFMVEPESLSMADIDDAMGELTNVTAGRVQAGVPGAGELTLPILAGSVVSSVGEGAERWSTRLCCEGRPVRIVVHWKESGCAS